MNKSRRDAPIVCWLGLGVIVLFVSAAFTPLPNLLAECVALAPEPGPADAIVILAGGGASELYRPVGGIVLYRRGLAPLVVFSGAEDETPPESQSRAELARQLGVPDAAILTVSAHTTREEAVRIERLLRPRSVRKILLVTGAQHMVRAKPLFERAGFEVLAAPADAFPPQADTPEARLQLARQTLLEILALLSYRVAQYL